METGLRKRQRGLGTFTVFGVLAWTLAGVQTNGNISDVHVQWFSCWRLEQMIVMSCNDITRISHAIEGGNYKRRAQPNLRAVIWALWYKAFGSICKSQTLYFRYLGASRGAEHNQNGLCDLFIHMYVPRPFWKTFSQCGFSCLMLAG